MLVQCVLEIRLDGQSKCQDIIKVSLRIVLNKSIGKVQKQVSIENIMSHFLTGAVLDKVKYFIELHITIQTKNNLRS